MFTTPLLLKFESEEAAGLHEFVGHSFASMDVRGPLERAMLVGVTAAIWMDYAFISFAVLRIRRVMGGGESRQVAAVNRQVLSIMLVQVRPSRPLLYSSLRSGRHPAAALPADEPQHPRLLPPRGLLLAERP